MSDVLDRAAEGGAFDGMTPGEAIARAIEIEPPPPGWAYRVKLAGWWDERGVWRTKGGGAFVLYLTPRGAL